MTDAPRTPAEREAQMAQQRQDNDDAAIAQAQKIQAKGGPANDREQQQLDAGLSAADHRRSRRRNS